MFAKRRGVNFDRAQIELMVMNHDAEPYISVRPVDREADLDSGSESTLSTLWLCNFMQIIDSRSLLESGGENVMRKIVKLCLLVFENSGPGDTAQWSKAHTVLVGDRSLVPSAHTG